MARSMRLETLTVLSAGSEGKRHTILFCLSRNGPACVETAETISVRANTLDRAVKHLADRYRASRVVRTDVAVYEAASSVASS